VGNAGRGWRGPVVSACRGEGARMADQRDLRDRRARRTGLMKEHGGEVDRQWSVDFGNRVDFAQTGFHGDRGRVGEQGILTDPRPNLQISCPQRTERDQKKQKCGYCTWRGQWLAESGARGRGRRDRETRTGSRVRRRLVPPRRCRTPETAGVDMWGGGRGRSHRCRGGDGGRRRGCVRGVVISGGRAEPRWWWTPSLAS
jgi:hypothetical protein